VDSSVLAANIDEFVAIDIDLDNPRSALTIAIECLNSRIGKTRDEIVGRFGVVPLLNADVYTVGNKTMFNGNNPCNEDIISVEEHSDIEGSEMFLDSRQIKAGDSSVNNKVLFRT